MQKCYLRFSCRLKFAIEGRNSFFSSTWLCRKFSRSHIFCKSQYSVSGKRWGLTQKCSERFSCRLIFAIERRKSRFLARDLDLNVQGRKFKILISRKRQELAQKCPLWLLWRIIFAIEYNNCECYIQWPRQISRVKLFSLLFWQISAGKCKHYYCQQRGSQVLSSTDACADVLRHDIYLPFHGHERFHILKMVRTSVK